jgi:prolyl 4-hydroxylase
MQPSGVSDQASALAQRGAVDQAYRLLESAVANGDGLAAATLAEWRLSGQVIRRDLAQSRDLYGKAAAFGIDAAEPVHIALLANGAGGSGRRWQEALSRLAERSARDLCAARQSSLVAKMTLTNAGDPLALPAPIPLSSAPLVETLPGFLTSAECRYLVERAGSFLKPSMVVHPQTGALVRDPVRSASSASFPFVLEDPALHAINRRIAAATGTTYEQGEPLQVLRYGSGEEYKLHSDALPLGGEQRIMTLLVALGDDFEGGETSFPRLDLSWRGKPGEALVFRNVDAAGRPDQRAWHAGRPVARGTKLLLSKWIRERPLDLSGPPGRPF